MVKSAKRVRRKRRRPFRQGDLDALCGVYSIINAVRSLCLELSRSALAELFHVLMKKLLSSASAPTTVVTWGIGRLMHKRLVTEAVSYVLTEFGIELKARRLPQAVRKTRHRDQLFRTLEAVVSPTCVAIIALEGTHSHWTVMTKITPVSIRLFDSGHLLLLARSRCTAKETVKGHQIVPNHVLLLERVGHTE